MHSNRLRWVLAQACLLVATVAVAQTPEIGAAAAPVVNAEVQDSVTVARPWGEQVDSLIAEIAAYQKNSSDADRMFHQLDPVLHDRIHQINRYLRTASSPTDSVSDANSLPADIRTIADLHANIDEMYRARVRLLPHLSDPLRLEVTAMDVIGVEQLTMESEYVWEQIKFRALNLPAASENLLRRIQIAPLPIIWRFIQFMLVIALFRWWRNWLPETLRRMQVSLAEIRPRTPAVIRRLRLLWYVEQLRRPLEWMLVLSVLLSMIQLEGLNLLVSIVGSIVRWVLLGWLAVAALDAFAARGAAGISGEDSAVRLKSLRLIAAWLVLLGLGLDLADDLTGVATTYAWVWRLFQVLALPVLLLLLAWWRQPIFARLERESEGSESAQAMLEHRSGIRSFTSAAKGGLWLVANNLRRSLMRVFLHVGDVQGLGLTGVSTTEDLEAAEEEYPGITVAQYDVLMSGESGFDKYARTERRNLIRRARNSEPGIVAVVGERGIGKGAFLNDIHVALEGRALLLACKHGTFAELQAQMCEQLEIAEYTLEAVAEALKTKEIGAILVKNIHRLSRPVADGQAELHHYTDFVEAIEHKLLWIISVDCFAWQFMRRVRADQASIHEVIELPAWTEEQIAVLLDQRNLEAGIEPDFSNLQIPAEHAVTDFDTAEERNKAGIYRMIWTVSGGNPAVSLLMWSSCLYFEEQDSKHLMVRLPLLPSSRELDSAAHNSLLVLRCIAQADLVAETDIADNLRLLPGAVGSAMHFCESRGWIEIFDGRYRLSMQWFKTITRVLGRQNLLAR